MRRTALAVVALAGLCAPARADNMLLVEDLPAAYTPGQPFTFTVRSPELIGLSGYRLELVFDTGTPNPDFVAFPTFPTDSYVFPTSGLAEFGLGVSPGGSIVTLTITDPSPDPGSSTRVVDVAAPRNVLAQITVVPGRSLTQPLFISFGGGTEFFVPSETEPPVSPPDVTIPVAQTNGNPVPAPPGLALLAAGGLVLGIRRRFVRRAA